MSSTTIETIKIIQEEQKLIKRLSQLMMTPHHTSTHRAIKRRHELLGLFRKINADNVHEYAVLTMIN